jgi:casein kinase II subunit alpha
MVSLSTAKSPRTSLRFQKKGALRSVRTTHCSSFTKLPAAAPTIGPAPLLTLPTSASPPVHSVTFGSNPSLPSRSDRGVATSESVSPGAALGTRSKSTLRSTSLLPEHVPIHQVDEYMLIRRLGAGKFSDVFEALHVPAGTSAGNSAMADFPWGNNQTLDDRHLVVVKCLKPVSERKIRREIRMLCRTQSLPNVVRLLAVVVPEQDDAKDACENDDLETVPVPRMPALILSHAGPQAQWLCHPHQVRDHPASSPIWPVIDSNVSAPPSMSLYLTDYEIRYYLCHLLVALEALHANHIMHRDVKPRNILINRRYPVSVNGPQQQRRRQRPLVLIDLGLADVVVPGQAYNVRVASRHFKSPELLLNYRLYGPPIDLWGVGCILAGILLRREPFFRGKDNVDQLQRIAAVLGTQDLYKYIKKYAIAVPDDMHWALESAASTDNSTGSCRRPWSEFIGNPVIAGVDSDSAFQPRHLLPADGLDLLDRLLVFDHEARWTATQAIEHEYFDMVRNRVRLEVKMYP